MDDSTIDGKGCKAPGGSLVFGVAVAVGNGDSDGITVGVDVAVGLGVSVVVAVAVEVTSPAFIGNRATGSSAD